MSIFNFTNPQHTCQKGFLLLEALVTLCALSALMLAVASWYSNSVHSQRFIHERLQAMALASSYIEKYQSLRQVPPSGSFVHDGYTVKVIAQQDQKQADFYWINVTVTKDSLPVLAEFVSGMVVGSA